ncbi:phage protein Gp27 family protein [Ensifer aridi]|uniref:phage protein Gp27 family protein n=1 Tax=Ensifer aridi TaxID=1708715 RepID=UPI000A107CC5|nr:phage protein Gp27 family protein [Ensifer aridi]
MGRGRPTNIEMLPEACGPVVAWAADELQKRDRTQTDIYSEFVSQLEAIQREHRGEIEFPIPSFSAFNRYSIKLATLTSRLNETREIASTLAEKFDAADSDNLTLIAAEAIKTLIFELLTNSGEAGIDPKGAMSLANALRAAAQAQGVSTARRQKVEKDLGEKVGQAVDAVEKAGKKIDKEEVLRIIREAYSGGA